MSLSDNDFFNMFSERVESVTKKRILWFFIIVNTALSLAYIVLTINSDDDFQKNKSALVNKVSQLCWVAYAPSRFDPQNGIYPSQEDIRKDLVVLLDGGFDGIVTFGSEKSLKSVPQIAIDIGFDGVIMGVWDPNSDQEIKNAISASRYVDGYCVGHMGLNKHYKIASLKKKISELRSATSKPVTTSEGFDLYKKDSQLLDTGDWLFPDAQLYWKQISKRTPKVFIKTFIELYTQLTGQTEKTVLIKTIGFPTNGGPEASTEAQVNMFQGLLDNSVNFPYERVRFVYFEAFDQPWKNWHISEPHWGIFNNNRSPKPGVDLIWGKKIPESQRLGFDGEKKNDKKWTFLIIGLCCNLAAAISIFFFLWMLLRFREKRIRLLRSENRLLFYKNGKEIEIQFPRTHNKCISILAELLISDIPLSCGQLIHQAADSNLIINCKYSRQNGCSDKRQFCQAYRTLSNHRISTVRKVLLLNEIGNISIIPGKSEWRLILDADVRFELVC